MLPTYATKDERYQRADRLFLTTLLAAILYDAYRGAGLPVIPFNIFD